MATVVIGQVYEYLTVLRLAEKRYRIRHVLVRCVCGAEKVVSFDKLAAHEVKSCGCMKSVLLSKSKSTHGAARTARFGGRTAEYGIWKDMKKRCYNVRHRYYADYGGRGVCVCSQWRADFSMFLVDMGPRPGKGFSVERRDNSQGYNPENCYWATQKQQMRNTRRNVNITAFGTTACMAAWTERTGLTKQALTARLRKGWSHEAVVGTPPRTNGGPSVYRHPTAG